MASAAKGLRRLPLSYDESDFENSARNIVYEINPHWRTDPGPVVIKRFTEGIMNTLLKLTKEAPGRSDIENDNDAVLLRSYGRDSDIMIDREMEVTTHMLLSDRDLAAPLLARFEQGLLYKFNPGRVCTEKDFQQEPIWRAVAARLGEWHARLPLPNIEDMTDSDSKPPPSHPRTIWTVMQEWLDALPSKTEDQKHQQQLLQEEFGKCSRELNGEGGEDIGNYILGHCDLLSANVIIPPDENSAGDDLARQVHFIDFEYAVPCPPAYDLANHFSEWAGYDCDYHLLPTRSTRRRFIEQYLEYYGRHAERSENLSVDQLCHEVDTYRGMPGLVWGVFSLIQQEISEVKFDWPLFAERKLAEFWAWRRETDGSREKDGEDVLTRERKWGAE